MTTVALPVNPTVTVVEVGPRDGLQDESALVPLDAKVRFVELLADAGLPVIEVGAFVNPARVPQMADTAELFRRIRRAAGVRYTALVPNQRGLAQAVEAGADEVAIFAAASDTFSRRNINRSIAESMEGYAAVCREASAAGRPVRAYLSTAFGCPFEGPVPVDRVHRLTLELVEMGAYQVAVSDTIGVAHPGQVATVLEALTRDLSPERLALHVHDTRGTALSNVLVGLQAGLRTFDAAAGGLGGCPFAPGASGNLATEELVYLLQGLGAARSVDLARVAEAARFIEALVGRRLPSRYLQAAAPPRASSPPA
jgi:isopropylmalate/homocitrate/citramalate synthase